MNILQCDDDDNDTDDDDDDDDDDQDDARGVFILIPAPHMLELAAPCLEQPWGRKTGTRVSMLCSALHIPLPGLDHFGEDPKQFLANHTTCLM